MSKSDFLKILRESLSGVLEKSDLKDQLDYYEKYIDDEMKSGRTEKEVIAELGDPRLIAKTIKTVSSTGSSSDDNKSYSDNQKNYDDTHDDNSSSNTYRRTSNRYGSSQGNGSYMSVGGQNAIIGCIIVLLVIFIIVYGTLKFVGSVAFSGPIGFLLVMGLFYYLFGRGRR